MKFQRNELIIPSILTVICWIVYPYPAIAMWTVFFLASYSAIANDSIQTIGTFIASNSDSKISIFEGFFTGQYSIGTTAPKNNNFKVGKENPHYADIAEFNVNFISM